MHGVIRISGVLHCVEVSYPTSFRPSGRKNHSVIQSNEPKVGTHTIRAVIRATGIFLVARDTSLNEALSIEIDSVGCYGVRLPSKPLSLMYGFRNVLSELAPMIGQASSIGQTLYEVDVRITVTRSSNIHASVDDLPHIDSLNMGRARRNLKDLIVNKWRGYLQGEAIRFDEDLFRYDDYVVKYPWLLDRLIDESEFGHLKTIVYPAEYNNLRTQRVAIYSRDAIDSYSNGNFERIELRLPRWLK